MHDRHAPPMTDQDQILALNQALYRAFASRDVALMERLWADHLPVSCIHPGWPPLFGRAEVMLSWRDLLRGPADPAIRAREEKVTVYGDVALVTCEEVLNARTVLVASNLFAREHGAWRLVHHQATPLAEHREPGLDPGGARRLH